MFKLSYRRFGAYPPFAGKTRDRLGIGSSKGLTQFHKVEVVEVTGEGEVFPAAAPKDKTEKDGGATKPDGESESKPDEGFTFTPGLEGLASADELEAEAGPLPPEGRGLKAEIFEGNQFERRVGVRYDAEVDFDWGEGRPAPAAPADLFGMRWTGYLRVPVAGAYKLITHSDDTVKLWLNDQEIIAGTGKEEVIVKFEKRTYSIRIDYNEFTGPGHMTFQWQPPGTASPTVVPTEVLFVDRKSAERATSFKRIAPPRGTGVTAEIYAGRNLERRLLKRVDRQIDWAGIHAAYAPGMPADNFSIRFTTWLKAPQPGRYVLRMTSDDGSRLWLDGKLLIDAWGKRRGMEAMVTLTDKPHALQVDYYDVNDSGHVSVHWEQEGGFGEVIIPPEAFFTDKVEAARKRL